MLASSDFNVDQAVSQEHRLEDQTASKAAPYDMWSYQGSSYDWGEDDVVKINAKFSRPNEMGAIVKGGYGGGIPVVAFWTQSVGEAIGHIETLPLRFTSGQGRGRRRVNAVMTIPANTTLKPGETFSTPRISFRFSRRLLRAFAALVERSPKRRLEPSEALG